MAEKKKKAAHGGPEGPWKRIALTAIFVSVALAAMLLSSRRGGSAQDAKISAFIDTYFQTWSDRDMTGYKNCFHPEAVIHFVDAGGTPRGSALDPFIESQRQVHASARVPMREIPLSKDIEVDGNVARALVRWKLFNESGEEVGTDYFDLVNTKTGWRIVSLIFRKDGS